MRKLMLLVVIALALPWGSAAAQKMYKWVDPQGKVSYHDRPPPEGSEFAVEEKRLGGSRYRDNDESSDAAQKFPVVLYSVPRCANCDLARHYLKRNNVPFTEKAVDKDVKLQQELQAKSGTLSVPTILVGPKVLNGYLESLLEGELKQAGYLASQAPAPTPTSDTSEPEEESADESPDDGGLAPTE